MLKSDLKIPEFFFHASKIKYNIGDVISGDAPFYKEIETVASGQDSTAGVYAVKIAKYSLMGEVALEGQRPQNMASRMVAVFACDNENDALAYAHMQYKKGEKFYLYKVKMTEPLAVPMALVTKVRSSGTPRHQHAAIAHEYWQPKNSWNYWEYMSARAEIIDIVGEYFCLKQDVGTGAYRKDQAIANAMSW